MPTLRRDFHFAGQALRVEADPEPLLWLQDFVEPQFAARDTADPAQTLRLVIDPEIHRSLAGCGPHPSNLSRPCITLDSGVVRGRLWQTRDGAEIVFDETADVFYRRPPETPDVVDLIATDDTTAARVALMRALREYTMLYAAHAGWLMVHAAAVCIGDDAFVIAGPKRAGKTTMLLHALANERGVYVSNDRVALQVETDRITVHGLPTIVSIRPESARWFPGLDASLSGVRFDGRPAVAAHDRHPAAVPPAVRSHNLSPRQLCERFGVPSRAAARVAGLLYPDVGAAEGAATFEALGGAEALDALRATVFRACPPDGMFRIDPAVAIASTDALTAEAARRVPSFRCRLGPDAYRGGAGWLRSLRAGCHTSRG